MKASAIPISFDRKRVAAFCRAHGIRRLCLFGSILREDFDPARSDVDVLAEFGPDALHDVGFRYFGYADELAEILGHKVDFCSRLHPALERQVRQEAVPIYEQA
jgi:predicted nucleotidyltransferase